MRRLLACFLLIGSFWLATPAFAAESPLAPGEHTFVSNGLKLWYKVSGAGPVAIFPTPGWGPSAEYLFLSLQPLEQQFTVVWLDTRATGRSEVPKGDGMITLADFSFDLDNLRRHLGRDRVWFIGHSMGGSQVLDYALRHPDHVNGLVMLAGTATWNDPDAARWAAYQRASEEQVEAKRGRPGFEAALEAFRDETIPRDEAEFKARMLAMAPLDFEDASKAQRASQAFEQVRFSLAAYKRTLGLPDYSIALEPELHKIRVPTLIVNGTDDEEVPWQQALVLHRGIAGSKLLIIPKAGHFSWIEQPEAFYEGLRLLLPALGYKSMQE